MNLRKTEKMIYEGKFAGMIAGADYFWFDVHYPNGDFSHTMPVLIGTDVALYNVEDADRGMPLRLVGFYDEENEIYVVRTVIKTPPSDEYLMEFNKRCSEERREQEKRDAYRLSRERGII